MCTTELVKAANNINEDMCGAKLLPTTVSAYPVNCVFSVTDRHSTAAFVQMEGITHLWLSAFHHHPYYLSHPPTPYHATCDITYGAKKLLKIQQCYIAS